MRGDRPEPPVERPPVRKPVEPAGLHDPRVVRIVDREERVEGVVARDPQPQPGDETPQHHRGRIDVGSPPRFLTGVGQRIKPIRRRIP